MDVCAFDVVLLWCGVMFCDDVLCCAVSCYAVCLVILFLKEV